MRALLSALLLAVSMPVRPVSPTLVADLGRGKPLVLHFFASWCTACREEFPRLRPHLLALPSRGVAVDLITIDRPGDKAKAEKMLREHGLSALPSLLLDAPDPDPVAAAVGEPKWDGTLPATFVFDSAGKLRKSFIGQADPARLEAAVAEVAKK